MADITTIENKLAQVEVKSESHFMQFGNHIRNTEGRNMNNFNVEVTFCTLSILTLITKLWSKEDTQYSKDLN